MVVVTCWIVGRRSAVGWLPTLTPGWSDWSDLVGRVIEGGVKVVFVTKGAL